MTQEEMKNEFYALYNMMANSNKVENMRTFGNAHKEMMEWFVANKPELAQEWIDKLSAIKWKNYLTQKEADIIVENMKPNAPWSRDQWKSAMKQYGYVMEEEPYYNSCALYVTMNMIMSDSSKTISKYVGENDIFAFVHDMAVDNLKDQDGKFVIREYFKV